MPKIHVIRSLGRTLFFLHLSAGVFHTYIKTRCCCIVGQCIPCLLPFLIYFRLVQFAGNIFVFRSKLIGWSTNTLIFFCCQSLKSNPQTEISTLFSANSLPLLASSCLSFLALRIVSAYVLLFACFNSKTFFAASVLFGVLVIFALRR